jgi:ankyrin repeat protein
MDDVCFSMLFLTPPKFEELIEVKKLRLEQQDSQTHLDNWFHFACLFDLPEMALILHCAGADVNSKKPGGWTALHAAVLNKRSLQLVQNLLEIEADPLAANDDGITALHLAALSNDNPDVVQQILNYSMDRDPNCRCLSTKFSGITARDLAVLNPNPLIQDLFSFSEDLVGPLPGMLYKLTLAAMSGDVGRINYVIDKGANVNLVDETGRTSLHHICGITGSIKVVKALLKAGADPNIQDNQGMTALHLAVIGANVESAEYLLNSEYIKANPNLQANNLRTCLHYVPAGLVFKLEDGFSILDQSTYRDVITSLARANSLNVQAIEEHILESFHREAQNTIPPAWTHGEKHCRMIEILLAAGAKLDIKDDKGNTPLHSIAANSQLVETTKLL